MKKRLAAAFLALLTALPLLGAAVPEAHAKYPLNDGTIVDPGSHGLIIENMETKLITSEFQIRKLLKRWGEEADEDYDPYEDFYKDCAIWEITTTVRNNFPVDLYGYNLMCFSYDQFFDYYQQNFQSLGHTLDENYLPEGYDFGEVVMKPGETHTYTFYECISPSSSDGNRYPKYYRAELMEVFTADDCIGLWEPQISPYYELDDCEKTAKKFGVSPDAEYSAVDDGIEITDVALIPADPETVLKDGEVDAGTCTVWPDDVSEEDVLLELQLTLKNTTRKDIENSSVYLLFYNRNGDMVRRDEYAVRGTIPAGGECTFSEYYYAEDPYYIPDSIMEVGGTEMFQVPVTLSSNTVSSDQAACIAAGAYHTVFVRPDGTVAATGLTDDDRCKVDEWTGIVAVDAFSHTVGLKSDGTVVAAGSNGKKQCDVSRWENIIAIAAGETYTVGLKSDGTVVAVGNSANKRLKVSGWQDIIAIDAGSNTTYGLKANGTVVVTGSNSNGQANVGSWSDITAISAGYTHVVGLKSDGTVVAAGSNSSGECDVSGWRDIVAVAAGSQFTIGLKSDGTVVAIGNNKDGQCDVSDWKNISTIDAGMFHVIGIREDGSYVAAGRNSFGQCNLPKTVRLKAEPQTPVEKLLHQVYAIFQSGESADVIPLLEEAAELGSRQAKFQLGVLYLASEYPGLKQDVEKAHALMVESVSQEGLIDDLFVDPDFVFETAFRCYQTDNWETAEPLLTYAAEMGHAQAQSLLALRTWDMEKQSALYQQAADRGYLPAIYSLAVNYEYGYGVEADTTKAYELFDQAAAELYKLRSKEIEDPFIALTIGYCYSYGDTPFSKDYDKAAEFFELAGWLGDPEGAYRYGRLIYDGKIEGTGEDIVGWFNVAGNAGHETALYILGSMYLSGLHVEKDENLGLSLIQAAAERDSVDALNYLENNILTLY